ncbi:SDR family oxidoreductase [Actinophytocola oryzae]|uniref:3-oxoacyl-[acyl-carrier protein] reductase n=1 Tax=Actinophytocola oryzae TaxID=502181 RepID=A0A4R7VUB8_9PSEU|nr:SDR family oxidoreductase [Actinophytocola oryzae]TDV53546.1 3-oxoacyl-[acyl-carrier protein] reductase [Actinophytocola oryzae]
MDLGLKDRVYLVTGGTRGLGFATASALVDEGARVVLTGRSEENVEQAAASLGCAGVACDNADPATPDRLIEVARERFGRVDGLLVSVGGPPSGSVTEVTDEQWRTAFESVFLGAVRLARTVAASLSEGGSIAFVLSSSVRVPIGNLGISNGLRPGLAMAAKAMANELGPRGVRVNGLVPGRIATDRLTYVEAKATEEERAAALAAIPLGRYGDPEEFGRVAAFVLSPAASYLTGSMLAVDGGMLPAL